MADLNLDKNIELVPLAPPQETTKGKEQPLKPESGFGLETKPAEAVPEIKTTGASAPSLPVARPLPPLAREIENVLEEGLEDIYRDLTPAEQAEFKKSGEATAQKIYELIRRVKIKVREIFRLIREWLKTIPGVNKYFIEQEAKIKADKIFKLHD